VWLFKAEPLTPHLGDQQWPCALSPLSRLRPLLDTMQSKAYLWCVMIYEFDIMEPRIARLCLHAGRLHSGV
jgi:hypothetical protein